MPTTQTVHLPKPTDWDEFERICLSACELRWSTTRLTRHGRRGQAQQGVDIFGDDNLGRPVGVQCKNTIAGISSKVIDQEITNAESFSPGLASLYIATTADTDASLQQYVRVKSLERLKSNKFTVDILFWGDVTHDLVRSQDTLQRLYPQFFSGNPSSPETPRQRDVKELTRLLSVIDLLNVERYLDYAPKYVAMAFLEHTEQFLDIVGSPLFHLNDPTLLDMVDRWLSAWQEVAALIGRAPYDGSHNLTSVRFYMPMDCVRPEDAEIYSKLENAISAFRGVHVDFCRYLRQNFPEVDVVKSSSAAQRLYTPRPMFG